MSADETYTLCPRCQRKVVPEDYAVHFAVELQRVDSFGGSDWVEGVGGFFHPACAVLPGWRPKPYPQGDAPEVPKRP